MMDAIGWVGLAAAAVLAVLAYRFFRAMRVARRTVAAATRMVEINTEAKRGDHG